MSVQFEKHAEFTITEESRDLLQSALEEIIGDGNNPIGRAIEEKGMKIVLSSMLDDVVSNHSEVILNSHNESVDFINTFFKKVLPIDIISFPKLIGLDDVSFLDYLNKNKLITKPELRKYLINSQSDSIEYKPNQKLKQSTQVKAIIAILRDYGIRLDEYTPNEAFSKKLEYKVLQIAAKVFDLPPFKSIVDLENSYWDEDVFNAVCSNNTSSDLQETLSGKNHLTPKLICFSKQLFDKIDSKTIDPKGNLDIKQLSEIERNIAIVALHTIRSLTYNPAEFKFILSCLNSKTAIYLFINHLYNQGRANVVNDTYLYDSNYKLNDLAENIKDILVSNKRHFSELIEDEIDTSYSDEVSIIEYSLRDFAEKIVKIAPYFNDLEKLTAIGARDEVKSLKEIKDFGTMLNDSSLIDDSYQNLLISFNQIEDLFDSYLEVDDATFVKNIAVIKSNIGIVKLFFKEENISEINQLEKSILEGIENIVSLAKNHNFSAIAKVTEKLDESKRQFYKLIHKLIMTVHKRVSPLEKEAAPESETEASESIEINVEDIIKQKTDLEEQIQTLKDSVAMLELEVEHTKEALENSRESNAKLSNDLSALQSKHEGLQKKLSGQNNGYSKAMCNVLFGKPSVSDVVECISEAYPGVIFADNMNKIIEKCLYKQPEKLHLYLKLLVDDYFSAITSGTPDSVARKIIEPHYSANESDTTMNDVNFRNKRNFKVNGTTYLMEQHLTIGNEFDPTKTVQVYFKIEDEKLMIGYIGEHLDISSTK